MLDFLSKPVYCSLTFCAKSILSRLSVVLKKCSHLQCGAQLCHWRAQEGFWKDGGFLGFSLVFVLLSSCLADKFSSTLAVDYSVEFQ